MNDTYMTNPNSNLDAQGTEYYLARMTPEELDEFDAAVDRFAEDRADWLFGGE